MHLQCPKYGDVEFATPFVTCAGQKPSKLASQKLERGKRESGRESYPAQPPSSRSFLEFAGNFRLRPTRRTLENIAPQPVNNYPRWRTPPTQNDFVHRHSLARDDAAPGERQVSAQFLIIRVNIIKIVEHRAVAQIILFFFVVYYFYIVLLKWYYLKSIVRRNIFFHFFNSSRYAQLDRVTSITAGKI